MLSLVCISCAIYYTDIDLAKIESIYNVNDESKKGYLFNYNIFKSNSSKIEPDTWNRIYRESDHIICRFYEDEQQIFFIGNVKEQKATIEKVPKSGNTAKMSVMLDHTSIIFKKAELIQYTRIQNMTHIQLKNRAKAHIPEATPINFGQLGSSNDLTIDALLRAVRAGKASVISKRITKNTISLQFHEKANGLHVDVVLDEDKNFAPLYITLYDDSKDQKINCVQSECSKYELHQGAFYYPSLIKTQLLQNGKPVMLTTIELTSITKPTPNELKDQVDKPHSINVDGMLYSNMNNTLKQIGYEDVPRLYQQCEELSQRTLAAKAPKTTSSRMPYVLTAVGLMLVLLVYLYIRRTRKMSLLATT